MKKISIVTSLYRSADYVFDFYHRHLACIRQLNVDYEFVFVDDGYPDESIAKVKQLIESDSKVKLVVFSRNFGQYPAMFAGMANSVGDYIYTTDSDLEESPENILMMYNRILEEPDIDFLYGVVNERSGGLIRGFVGGFFYKMMRWATDINIPQNISWQLIMTKKYVESLLLYNEAETLPAGLMMLTGFRQESIPIDKVYKGSTSYTLKKRLKLALNSVTAFSSKPLVFIGLMGIFITIVSFTGILAAILIKLFFINYQAGWISIILSIWFMGGLILSSVGIIGIYLAKIFNQVKGRPLYIIKSIVTASSPAGK